MSRGLGRDDGQYTRYGDVTAQRPIQLELIRTHMMAWLECMVQRVIETYKLRCYDTIAECYAP